MAERRPVRVLREDVARRIAAGEVIDRPAAMVRELMDNAVDSGADDVLVEVDKGGIARVAVTDNGSGMTRDDLSRCAVPHATSKIVEAEDLDRLTTLGFRGEALSSIAAVGTLTITSGTSRMTLATGRGREIRDVPPFQNGRGTRVEGAELFADLPARRRFLKRPASETMQCRETFVEKAIPRPDIAFRLTVDGSVRLDLPKATSLADRLADALEIGDRKLLHQLQSGGTEPDGKSRWRLTLVIADPSIRRSDRRQLLVYVNGRRVNEFSLMQAVEYGCQGFYPNGTHPVAALFAEVDPSLVDFNVHPAKREVKFRDVSALHHGASSLTRNFLRTLSSLSVGTPAAAAESAFDRALPAQPQLVAEPAPRTLHFGGAISAKPDDFAKGEGSAFARLGGISEGGAISAKPDDFPKGEGSAFARLGGSSEGGVISAKGGDFPKGDSAFARLGGSSEGGAISAKPDDFAKGGSAFANLGGSSEGGAFSAKPDDFAKGGSAFANLGGSSEGGAISAKPDDFAKGDSAFARLGGISEGGAFSAKPDDFAKGDSAFARLGGSSEGGAISAKGGAARARLMAFDAGRRAEFMGGRNGGARLRYVGRAMETFIIAELGDSLLFIDQHAAHERILFDEMTAGSGETAQSLLVPYRIETDDEGEEAAIGGALGELAKAGFRGRRTGDGAFEFDTVPARWSGSEDDLKSALLSADEPSGILRRAFASAACRKAVMAGTFLDDAEAARLAEQAVALPDPHCPHGRPVFFSMTRAQLYGKVRRTE